MLCCKRLAKEYFAHQHFTLMKSFLMNATDTHCEKPKL